MVYIEGFGDEVLLVFGAFFLLLLTVVVWLSTSVQEPRINLIVVDRDRFQQVLQRVRDAGYRIARFSGAHVINIDAVTAAEVTRTGNEAGDEPGNESEAGVEPGNESEAGIEPRNESEAGVQPRNESEASTERSDMDPVGSSERRDTDHLLHEDTLDSSAENLHNNEGLSAASEHLVQTRVSTGTADVLAENTTAVGLHREDFVPEHVEEVTTLSGQAAQTQPLGDSEGNTDTQQGTDSEQTQTSQSQPAVKKTQGYRATDSEQTQTSESRPAASDNRGFSTSEQAGESLQEGHIRVNLRFLDERQRIVQALPQETIGQFKRTHFARELAQNLVPRLIYNGRELRPDSQSLQAYNVHDHSVIHCILRQAESRAASTPESGGVELEEEAEIQLGVYIFPLFGLILALIWYSRFAYGKYFNAISTVALVGISFLYVVVLLASFRTQEEQNHIVQVHHEHQD